MSDGECWFCDRPAQHDHRIIASLVRDRKELDLLVVRHVKYRQTMVVVPRCRRCRVGHGIEKVVAWTAVLSTVITVLPAVLALGSRVGGTPWPDEWLLLIPVVWTAGWYAVWIVNVRRRLLRRKGWYAPRRYAEYVLHPAVEEWVAEGWTTTGDARGQVF